MLNLFKKFIRYYNNHGFVSAIRKTVEFLHYQLVKKRTHFDQNSIFILPHEIVKIVTPLHTLYIGELLQNALSQVNINSKIITEKPCKFENCLYIVIAPQIYHLLPKKRVIFFQVEQANSRWMTKKYFKLLRKANLVLDYSIDNIEKLKRNGIHSSKILYLPIGLQHINIPSKKRDIDILFYGDSNCLRRKKFLSALQKKFKIKIINNLFGEELRNILQRTEIVINIHYYENALLETTRICEAISYGCFIISEKSTDYDRYPELNNMVDFTEINDINHMCYRIDYWLKHKNELYLKRNNFFNNSKKYPNKFNYFFMRFLFYCTLIDFDTFYAKTIKDININSNRICLSLPEYKERYDLFKYNNKLDFEIFPGIRHYIPWIGCGLSYKYLAKYLLDMNKSSSLFIICEDDVDFPRNIKERLSIILEQLKNRSYQWDVFSGFIADFAQDTKIISIDKYKGELFIKINKMTSTVFMIYSKRALNYLSSWQQSNTNLSNTIDRFLQNKNDLITVTTKPFLVSHKENVNSTLWGGDKEKNNKELYSQMVDISQNKIDKKIKNFGNYSAQLKAGHDRQ